MVATIFFLRHGCGIHKDKYPARYHIHPSIGDGDGQFCSYNGRFGMRRHIVVTLAGMFVVRLTLLDKVVEDSFHICLYIRIGVLVDG